MENVSERLFNLLGTKFSNTSITTLTTDGKETTDFEDVGMFSFDFEVDGRNYGPVVILISADNNLEVYYGDNTSKSLHSSAKKKWENLIEHLSTFARSNRLGFGLKHTTALKYDLSNITDITESYKNIFEGYYGTKKTSYNNQGKAKIIIKHSRALGEDDKRFRNISSLFIENVDGERFKLPFTKLTGARAMARHVTEGGNPYDLFGLHITEMVKDINTLGGFVRRSKMFEDDTETSGLVETGRNHYTSLRKGLTQIAGKRGYAAYKESWEPSAITEQNIDTKTIRKLFTERSLNTRIEEALPLLARLQQMAETAGVTDYNPKSQGGTRKELLAKLAKTKSSADATAARKAGATQHELTLAMQQVEETSPQMRAMEKNRSDFPMKEGSFKDADTDEQDAGFRDASNGRPKKSTSPAYIRGYTDGEDYEDVDDMKELNEFEEWVAQVVAPVTDAINEGNWDFPDSSEKISEIQRWFQSEQPLGIDAMNATESLSGLIGDDTLFDSLSNAAGQNPELDARPIVRNWIAEINKNINNYNDADQIFIRKLGEVVGVIRDYDNPAARDFPRESVSNSEVRYMPGRNRDKPVRGGTTPLSPDEKKARYDKWAKEGRAKTKAAGGKTEFDLSMEEGLENELDADDETQLNASVNKSVDDYIKKEDTGENMKPYTEYVAEIDQPQGSTSLRDISPKLARLLLNDRVELGDVLMGRYDDDPTLVSPNDRQILQNEYDSVAADHGLHPDDDFEKITDRILDVLHDLFSDNKFDRMESTVPRVTMDDQQDLGALMQRTNFLLQK